VSERKKTDETITELPSLMIAIISDIETTGQMVEVDEIIQLSAEVYVIETANPKNNVKLWTFSEYILILTFPLLNLL
jgi:DNA polymerase III alpha subunit (gram-positive type)